MKTAKDLFSAQAAVYAAYRPLYPQALYDFLLSHAPGRAAAWDCATGNGQVAAALAPHFSAVFATDISEAQLQQAPVLPNVHYSVCRAESTPFADHSFDLVTVGTALHWFDFEAFYEEVRRVAKPVALLAVWAYAPCRSDAATDAVIERFQHETVGDYWDPERRWVDEEYRNIPFPFETIETPAIFIEVDWSAEQVLGYLESWSAVQHYRKATGEDPLPAVAQELRAVWGTPESKRFRFPLFLKAGLVRAAPIYGQ